MHVSKVNEWGSAKVYVDGEKVGEEALFGRCILIVVMSLRVVTFKINTQRMFNIFSLTF